MAEYNFREIEKKWQKKWEENGIYKVANDPSRPKYYVLDMFPYPSGAGLHVGHPLGYIATDIYSRYKRNKGFNVLHPMGFDAFGLPAEQYAIQTGQHPAKTTAENISRYKEQLTSIGFNYDWSREIATSDPDYYRWTQWIFQLIFNSWFDMDRQQARPIEDLERVFQDSGNEAVHAACDEDTPRFTAEEWKSFPKNEKYRILLKYRLTYLADAEVNWCPALGTVLANDEVKDGFSERGGYPVEKKKMRQWMMRTTAYSNRLLEGLEKLDWPEPVKEMQRNWIGKSKGCTLNFKVVNNHGEPILSADEEPLEVTVFTTRVDTAFGVTFMTLAPEHELVKVITDPAHRDAVNQYVHETKQRSERDRMADTKTISGVFTGAYAINPFNQEKVPIWLADYVLAGYGTGIVMAVPCSDTRDYAFAQHFGLPIVEVQDGEGTDISKDDFDPKKGTMINSGFLNGLKVPEAIEKATNWVEENGFGKARINYRMRDAVFSRQRYWGEPVPVYFKDDLPHLVDESDLPIRLPEVDEYLPTETGDPPLGRAKDWIYEKDGEKYPFELSTMPGWAGSSWYMFRYMDAGNEQRFAGEEALTYWQQVDLYVGGTEHAVGHLLYSRFWTKILHDRGYVPKDEPFARMINQGMIQGRSSFAYKVKDANKLVSYGLRKEYNTYPIHVDISLVSANDELDMEAFKEWRKDLADAEFVLEDGRYICGSEVEKMSKSKYNVVNPDDVIEQYGTDSLRLYEMFLGPVEQSKPWSTHGIDGVFKFLRKVWRLFHNDNDDLVVEDRKATAEELKILHTAIGKVTDDIERFSFNTVVSNLMICVNELTSQECRCRSVLKDLVILLSPLAPHLTEELWEKLGEVGSVADATFPEFNPELVKEDSFEYPVSVNGKMRAKVKLPVDMSKEEIEKEVLKEPAIQKWIEDKPPKKVIVVPKRIVNIVV